MEYFRIFVDKSTSFQEELQKYMALYIYERLLWDDIGKDFTTTEPLGDIYRESTLKLRIYVEDL